MSEAGFTGNQFRAPAASPARTRRVMPKPFQRPALSIGGPGGVALRREWHEIPVWQVSEGDTVPGVGLVAAVQEHVTHREADGHLPHWTFTLTGIDGLCHMLPGEHRVYAFVTKLSREQYTDGQAGA